MIPTGSGSKGTSQDVGASADMMAGELLTVKLELENAVSGSNHATITKMEQAEMPTRWIAMLVVSQQDATSTKPESTTYLRIGHVIIPNPPLSQHVLGMHVMSGCRTASQQHGL